MRNEVCKWDGATPNGAADEDELQASQTEILRLKKLIELLNAVRLLCIAWFLMELYMAY